MFKRLTAPIAALAIMVLGTGVVLGSHFFPDVPDSNQFHDDIAWMYDNGITHGYTNGNFGPRDVVNRQQMAAFMHRFHDAFPPIPGPEGPQGLVVLPQEQVRLVAGAELGVVLHRLDLGRPFREDRLGAGQFDEPLAEFGVDVAVDLPRQLHDVAIGVMDGLALDVRHGASSLDVFVC